MIMRLTMSVPLRKLRSSLTLKIFTICFAATHIPLLALVIYLTTGHPLTAMAVLVIALVATLAGTGFCLASVWALLRPLQAVAATIQTYRESGAGRDADATAKSGDAPDGPHSAYRAEKQRERAGEARGCRTSRHACAGA